MKSTIGHNFPFQAASAVTRVAVRKYGPKQLERGGPAARARPVGFPRRVKHNAVRLRAASRSRRLARIVGHLDLHGPGIAPVRPSGREHQSREEFAHRV
jgi:hypothetical protein